MSWQLQGPEPVLCVCVTAILVSVRTRLHWAFTPTDIAPLSINAYLNFDVDASFETTFVYSRRNFVLITLLNLQTANPFSAVPKINVFHLRLNVVTAAATDQL